jgi:integrase
VRLHGRGCDQGRCSSGTQRPWRAGLPDLCPCTCPGCLDGCSCSSQSHPTGRPHHVGCTPDFKDPQDCTVRYLEVGSKTAVQVIVDDIADLAWWSQRKALKRTHARNLKRAASGDPLHLSDGRGAAASAIAGSRWLFSWLCNNKRVEGNPAKLVGLPARQERPARSLDHPEILAVYRVAVTTGRDPQLDGLLVRHQLIHAVRRGGLLDATAGGLDPTKVEVTYYDRKRDTYRTRPSTRRHLACLLAHVLERGPRVAAPADAPDDVRRTGVPAIGEKDAVFYRLPVDTFDTDGYFVARQVRPVTAKHIETLFGRIKRHLPWARRCGLRPHDLRHSSARLIYRAADEQMAPLHLAHDAPTTTDHYLTEQLRSLARLKEEIFEDPDHAAD